MTTVDTHVHYIGEDPAEYVELLLRRMDENGVEKSVLFGVQGDPSCGDAGVWHVWNVHPDRFIPFACCVRCELPRDAEVFLNYAFDQPWQGIGEVYIDVEDETGARYALRSGREVFYPHYCPADKHRNRVYSQVFDECAVRGMPVSVHCRSTAVMDELLSAFPRTSFIWAHVDHMLMESDVIPLLDRHSNLCCEVGIQFRFDAVRLLTGEYGPHDAWLPVRFAAWQETASRHPSRILWGSDVFCWGDLTDPAVYRQWRDVLRLFCEPLSAEAASGVGGDNLLALLPE